MKNLKKLVIAIAVLALVASCAVVTVFSASVAEQELERAEQYYEVAVNQTTLSTKSAKLGALYTFVGTTTSLNDANADFFELKEKYMAFSIEIAEGFFAELEAASSADAALTSLNKIFTHFKRCHIDDNVKAYADYEKITAAAIAKNELLLRDLLDQACELGSYSASSHLLSKISEQMKLIPLDPEGWDYAIFLTRYHSILMDRAVELATGASKALDDYREDADAKYLEFYVKNVLALDDVSAKLDELEAVRKAAYDAAFDGFEYDENAVADAASAAFDAAYAAKLDELLLVYGSSADVAYNTAYYETYNTKIGEGATEADAVKAAKKEAKSKYDAAINALKAKALAAGEKGTAEYTAAALADISAKAVADGACTTADEAIAIVLGYIEIEAQKAGKAANAKTVADAEAERAAAADAAGEEAFNEALFKPVYDAAYTAAYDAAVEAGTEVEAAKELADAAAKLAVAAKKAEVDSSTQAPDIYVNAGAKDALKAAISEYDTFIADSGLDKSYGSFLGRIAAIDAMVKVISLDNAKFLFSEYDKIIADPTKYQYPLNSKAGAIYAAYNYMANNGLDASVPGYSEFYAKVNEAKTKYDADLLAAKEALDKQGDLSQHDWNTSSYHNYFKDFEDGKIINAYNPTSTSKSSLGQDTVGNQPNKFLQMNYGETSTHLYFEPSFANNAYGIVGDFDIKISEDFKEFRFQAMLKGVLCIAEIFYLKSNTTDGVTTYDLVYLKDDKNGFVTVPDLFTPDVWSHISFTFDPVTYSGKVYVNYEFIGDICYHDHDYQGGTFVTMQRMRIGVSKTFQTVGLDNLHFFSGTAYRDYHKFDDMTDADKFKYYVEYFEDAENTAFNRNTAYVKAKALYTAFVEDEAYADYTKYFTDETLADYYETEIKAPAIKANLQTIIEKADAVCAIILSSETTKEATAAIKDLRNFISSNVDFIDRTSDEYLEQMARVDKVDADIIRYDQVKEFTDAVTRFARATTLGSMQKHYEAAKQYYNLAGYGKEPAPGEMSNVDYVINDPVVLAFKEKHQMSPFDYYLEMPASIMAAREKLENSKKVIDALGFITSMEGYEDTEEFWAANYDYINSFVLIIRKIVSTGNYEPNPEVDVTIRFTKEEITEAVAHFEIIDAYFYELLQNEHIALITEQLENFTVSDTYIEKVGICSYITKYIEDNYDSIDFEREEIAELVYRLGVYSAELEIQEEDYASLLEENTQYFIATIAEMQSLLTYEELKPLYDKATTYYYGMNTNSKAAKAAMALYDEYGVKLASIEENSAFFIEYVGTLAIADKLSGIRKQDAIYEALVNAMTFVDGVDTTYTGVAKAYETYTAALEEYNTGAAAVNTEISGTADVACAVRTNVISGMLLAVVKSIITK